MNKVTESIIIADSDAVRRNHLSEMLVSNGFHVHISPRAGEVLEYFVQNGADTIIIGEDFPDMNGLELCRMIKDFKKDDFVPVLFISGEKDLNRRLKALNSGADAHVSMPADDTIMLAHINAMLRIRVMFRDLMISGRDREAGKISDQLTGLYNRDYVLQRLGEEFKRAERYNEPLGCILIEIDDFEEIVSRFDNDFIDYVIHETARRIEATLRETDIAARHGQEEFMLVLPNTHFSGALSVSKRALSRISSSRFRHGRQASAITATAGASVFPVKDIRTGDELIDFAERALSQARVTGRNQICLFQQAGHFYIPEQERIE